AETLVEQMTVVDEGVDRQKLDRRYAKRLDVVDDGLRAETGVEALDPFVDERVELGEALHVHLVDDRLVPRDVAATVFAMPIEVRVDDDRLRHVGRAVALVEGEVVPVRADRIAEDGGVPGELAGVGARVGVEEELVRVEAAPDLRLVGPVDAEAVEGSGPDAVDMTVEHLVRVLGKLEAVDLPPVRLIEDADVDARRLG